MSRDSDGALETTAGAASAVVSRDSPRKLGGMTAPVWAVPMLTTRLAGDPLAPLAGDLAAPSAACAHAAGISPTRIGEGLTSFRPYAGRLQVKKAVSGATVIDDTYNANPDSVRAAIDVLASCPSPTVLVLGDMGEVGTQGAEFHREVGAYARAKGISSLLALGQATRDAVDAFGAGGRHFAKLEELISNVNGNSILVKGSRFMKMERVVAALTGTPQGGH